MQERQNGEETKIWMFRWKIYFFQTTVYQRLYDKYLNYSFILLQPMLYEKITNNK